MTEKPFRDEDVLFRCRNPKWSHDPNEYIYVKDELLSSGIGIFRLDEWGHYNRQDGNNFHVDMLLRQLQASQERCGRQEDALRDIAGTEGANEYDAPAIARAALRKPRKKAALAQQEKGGGA